jgi:hypothetical protein
MLIAVFTGCAGPFEFRKTNWTVGEVQSWYTRHRDEFADLQKGIFYLGSDSRFHHFRSHLLEIDNWVIIEIRREEIAMHEEFVYEGASSSFKRGFYVDPLDGFKRFQSRVTPNKQLRSTWKWKYWASVIPFDKGIHLT